MNKTAKEKKVTAVPIWMGILVFLLAFGAGMVSKTVIRPAYSAQWSDALGTLKTDLPYGEGRPTSSICICRRTAAKIPTAWTRATRPAGHCSA